MFRSGIISAFMVVLSAGCAHPRSEENTSRANETSFAQTQKSEHIKFVATLRPLAEPVAINQIHSWRIQLSAASGAPVSGAVIHLGGGMPDHGHGFPTRPRVREIGGGEYLLEGMKFNMQGRWEIKLGVQAGDEFDVLTFNTMVALAADK